MPGLFLINEKNLSENESISEEDYDDDSEESDDVDIFSDDEEDSDEEDRAQEPTLAERLTKLERQLSFNNHRMESTENRMMQVESKIWAKFDHCKTTLANIEMTAQKTLLIVEAIAKAKGIDVEDILAQLPVGLSASPERGSTPVPITDAPAEVVDTVVDAVPNVEPVANIVKSGQKILLIVQTLAKAKDIDIEEILAQLTVDPSVPREAGSSPVPVPSHGQ